jgi:hypothetical protein
VHHFPYLGVMRKATSDKKPALANRGWREWKYLPKAEGEGSLAKLTDYRAVRTTVPNGSYLDPPGVGKLKVGVIVARRLAAMLWLQCHETS